MATTPIQYPLVNGARHSFVSIELSINGQIYVGFKEINYSRTRSRTVVMGNNADPIGKTRGTNEYKCDASLYLAEFNALTLDSLGGTTNGSYGDFFFTIFVTYSENGFDTIVDTIAGNTLDTTDASNSQGNDPTVRKVEFNPLKILFNGVDDNAFPLVGTQT